MEQHLFFNPGLRPFGPYPLLRPVLAYILGILGVHYLPFFLPFWFLPMAAGCILFFLLIKRLLKKKQAHPFVSETLYNRDLFWLLLLFVLLGGWNYQRSQDRRPVPFVTPDNIPLCFVVKDTPKETHLGKKEVFGILLLTSPLATQGHVLRWESSVSQLQNLEKEDTIFFEGPVLPFPRPPCPGAFDQRAFYNKKGLFSYTVLGDASPIEVRKGNYRPGLIERIRLFSTNKCLRYLRDKEVRGIVLQMLLGIRTDLDEETKKAFRNTGVMHILAVSGLHVGIIYLVLSMLAGGLFRRGSPGRIIAVGFLLSIVWFYAVLAGFRPSVVRASLMLSFIATGEVFRRNIPLLNSLSAAALINLFWKPEDIFDLGFMLSYAAVSGIALLHRPLFNLWHPPSWLYRLWELTCLSVSAQAGTLGITLVYFGRFPVFFILANWVAVPAAGVIIYSALLFLLAPAPFLSKLLATWLEAFVGAILGFLKGLDRLPFASLENLSFHPIEGLLITILLFLIFHVVINPGFLTIKRVLVIAIIWQAYLLSRDFVDNCLPGKFVVCGGKEAGIYLQRIKSIQPVIKINDIPPGVSLISIRKEKHQVCLIMSARNSDRCDPRAVVIWNNKKIFKRGVLTITAHGGDVLGPGVGIRKALDIKRRIPRHEGEIHAVSVDGYASL